MNNQNKFNIDEKNDIIYLITTSVGEDVSTSVRISWHCINKGSYLLYKKEEDEFVKIIPQEEYWSIEESYVNTAYQNKRYVCNVNLDNLEPGFKYKYIIISNDVCSKEYSFKTCDNNENRYQFLSFVDFQYSKNETTLNLVKTFIKNNPNANLITCSGDITDEGYSEEAHRFLFDSDVFVDSILSFGVGDHEYWGSDKSPIKMLKKPYAYNRLFNNPKNGCARYLNSSYYFKFANCLFVFLDCGDSNVSGDDFMFIDQSIWLDNVLSKELDYDFVIVCMHKSLYGDPKQDSNVKKFATTLISVFDKYKVDLVISGHDHEYSRTKPLFNSVINDKGTVYLDLGSSGTKLRSTGEAIINSNLSDKYINIKENNYSLGLVGTVSNQELDIKIYNQNYELQDFAKLLKKER